MTEKDVKSIFLELPDEINEGWRWGAIFGGMPMIQKQVDIARSYRIAAETLIGRNMKDVEAYEVLYPVLFLYRHATELYLKEICKMSCKEASENEEKGHGLRPLVNQFKQIVKTQYKQQIPAEILYSLEQLIEFDPKSQSFRYADKKGIDNVPCIEFWVDFNNLKEIMKAMFIGFERIIMRDPSIQDVRI